jgi:hypothetical protein
MVRSMSRRYIWESMSRLRKATSVPLTPRWLICVQTIQNKLEASVHQGCGPSPHHQTHLCTRGPDNCQGQLCRSNGRMPSLAWPGCVVADSCWNASSNKSCRRWREIRQTIWLAVSAARVSSSCVESGPFGCQNGGCICFLLIGSFTVATRAPLSPLFALRSRGDAGEGAA